MTELNYIDAADAIAISTDKKEEDFNNTMNHIFDKIRDTCSRGDTGYSLFNETLNAECKQELIKRGYKVDEVPDGPNETKTEISWAKDEEVENIKNIKTINVVDAIHLSIGCERNDSVDVRAGGPPILGYDFYVTEESARNGGLDVMKNELEQCCRQHRRGFISISSKTIPDFKVENIWTMENMQKCIKENEL